LHKKTRGEMVAKYFSEKVSPGVHDVGMKKEGFGVWKEEFLHKKYAEKELKLKKTLEEQEEMRLRVIREEEEARISGLQGELEREKQTRAAMLLKRVAGIWAEASEDGTYGASASSAGNIGPEVGVDSDEFYENFTRILGEFHENFTSIS
jgi:hypothetical protein